MTQLELGFVFVDFVCLLLELGIRRVVANAVDSSASSGASASATAARSGRDHLLDLGVTDPSLLAQSAEIDHHAERLIIDAAATAEARQRPHLLTGLSRSAGTAALVNHALKSGDSRAVALLRPPVRAQRGPPEREP